MLQSFSLFPSFPHSKKEENLIIHTDNSQTLIGTSSSQVHPQSPPSTQKITSTLSLYPPPAAIGHLSTFTKKPYIAAIAKFSFSTILPLPSSNPTLKLLVLGLSYSHIMKCGLYSEKIYVLFYSGQKVGLSASL